VSIDKFDGLRFKIKSWSITAAGVLAALAINTRRPAVLLVAVLLIFFFAFMEVLYMELEARVIDRSNEVVEGLLELARREGIVPTHDSYVFGIGKVFVPVFQWKTVPSLLRHRYHITIFYTSIILALLGGTIVLAAT
jgi:hypothetical protein